MVQTLSHAHIRCILNGHLFVGWAEDDPPYDFEYDDAVEKKKGQDGGLYLMGKPELGGVLTVKLAPNSPSCKKCMEWEEERKVATIQGDKFTTFSGSFRDRSAGVVWRLQGGAIQKLPATRTANQTYEGMFVFERIIADVGGGSFRAPLSTV